MGHSVWIVWGTDPDGMEPCFYAFPTRAELDAFLRGVEEAEGNMVSCQFDSENDALNYIEERSQ